MNKPNYQYSPQSRKAPASRAENAIGFFSMLAIIGSVFVGALGDILLGSLMLLGGILAFCAVQVTRSGR